MRRALQSVAIGVLLLGVTIRVGDNKHFAGSRSVLYNKGTAPMDCASSSLSPTAAQLLDVGIFTCGSAQTFTIPTASGSSGIVQALPMQVVGDVFWFALSSTASANVTISAGSNTTFIGNSTLNNDGTTVWCRVTGVTPGLETVSCYRG